MKRTAIVLAGAIGLMACACSDSDGNDPVVNVPEDAVSYDFTSEQSRAAQASAPFMDKVWLAAEALSASDESYVVSPLSADVLLSMVANTSSGSLGTEIKNALGCEKLTVLNEVASKYSVALPDYDETVSLGLCNEVWYKNSYTAEEAFSKNLQYYYGAEVVPHVFDSSLVTTVNDWCSNKTNGLVKEVISDVPADAVMVLANALYLKGAWANPFDSENTTDEVFHGAKGDATVKMMNALGMQHYCESETFEAVRMELGSGELEAVFVLPKTGVSLDKFLSANIDEINGAKYEDTKIDFALPRFKYVSGTMDMNSLVITAGIPSINEVDESNALIGCDWLKHTIWQSTSLEFNEQGAEGASVTWDYPEISDIENQPVVPEVTFNRPFYIMVRVATTGAPLFVGRMSNL